MRSRSRIVLSDSTVLVTGATGGIGRAVALALAARGARLVLTGRRGDELERVAEVVAGGGRVVPRGRAQPTASPAAVQTLVSDLSVRAEVARLAAEARAAGVDVLIANAAVPASGLLTELTEEQIDRMLEVNLRAPVMLARALAPAMAERRRGHLVFVSSLSGKAASAASSMYSATKFGLRGFALALRADLRPHGVGVSVVAPGFISDAGMYAKTGVELPPGVGTRTPEQVAAAVIRAIEENRAELEVAPAALRAGAAVASVAPGLAAWGSRVLGSDRIAGQLAERQRDQR